MQIVYDEMGVERRFQIGPESFVIGRDADCELVLMDALVSKRHVQGQVKDGQLHLKDLGSRNGIIVDGRSQRQCALDGGASFKLGNTPIRFEGDGQAAPPAQAVPRPGKDVVTLRVQKPGEKKARLFVTEASVITLGAAPTGDVVLEGEGVSRAHAEIYQRDGVWWVKDLGSRNGTYVNAEKIAQQQLESGDTIQVGTAVLGFLVKRRLTSLERYQSLPVALRLGVPVFLVLVLLLKSLVPAVKPGPDPLADPDKQFKAGMLQALNQLDARDYRGARKSLEELRALFPDRRQPALFSSAVQLEEELHDGFFVFTRWDALAAALAEMAAALAKEPTGEELATWMDKRRPWVAVETQAYKDYGAGLEQSGGFKERALELFGKIPEKSGFHNNAQNRIRALQNELAQRYREEGDFAANESGDWSEAKRAYRLALKYGREVSGAFVKSVEEKLQWCELNEVAEGHWRQANVLVEEGQYEACATELSRIDPRSRYHAFAQELRAAIAGKQEIDKALEIYKIGSGQEAIGMLQRLVDTGTLRPEDVAPVRARIEEVMRLFEAGEKDYKAKEYGRALSPLEKVLALEPDPENRYVVQARDMAAFCRKQVVEASVTKYEEVLTHLRNEHFQSALLALEELRPIDQGGEKTRQVGEFLAPRAEKWYEHAYMQIQLPGQRALYDKAEKIYLLLSQYLAEDHPLRAKATRELATIRKLMGK